METFNIDGVEIFAEGTWNGDGYTRADLESIVAAFAATQSALKPYLKIGHSESQKLLERDELPAAGWIENLRMSGSKLVADFKRVPKKIYDLIAAGAYSRVSSEIYLNFEHDGAVWPFALKAVSILGGETPAVATLDDIIALYGLDLATKPVAYSTKAEVKVYDFAKPSREEVDMKELEQAKADLAAAVAKLSESEAKVVAVEADKAKLIEEKSALEAKFAEAQVKIERVEAEKKHAAISATIEKLVADKKIVPAQKEILFALMDKVQFSGDTKQFKLGEKEYTPDGLVLAFVNAGEAQLPTESITDAGVVNDSKVDAAKKYASDNKVSLKEAMLALERKAQASEPAGDEE